MRVSGLGLDVGVLDERGLEHPARLDQPGGAFRRHLAGMHAPAGEHIVRTRRLDGGGARRGRVARVDERRERLPGDGDPIVGEPVQRGLVAGQRRDGLAAIPCDARREHRLILDVGIDAEAVDSRDVGGGEDASQSGMACVERGAVADGEARVRVRRTHHA